MFGYPAVGSVMGTGESRAKLNEAAGRGSRWNPTSGSVNHLCVLLTLCCLNPTIKQRASIYRLNAELHVALRLGFSRRSRVNTDMQIFLSACVCVFVLLMPYK